jgi:hypothetical protein
MALGRYSRYALALGCSTALMLPCSAAAGAGEDPPSAAGGSDGISAARFGGPDKPLVDPAGKPVRQVHDVKALINRVDRAGRNDLLKFSDTYQGDVCYANAGVTTDAGLTAVQSFGSGNNAGAFYYESATQCVMYRFGKWQGSYLNNLHICLLEIY